MLHGHSGFIPHRLISISGLSPDVHVHVHVDVCVVLQQADDLFKVNPTFAQKELGSLQQHQKGITGF